MLFILLATFLMGSIRSNHYLSDSLLLILHIYAKLLELVVFLCLHPKAIRQLLLLNLVSRRWHQDSRSFMFSYDHCCRPAISQQPPFSLISLQKKQPTIFSANELK